MTPEDFVRLSQAYGADLRRWPADRRAPAQRLMQGAEPLLASALAQARQLDALLDSHQPVLATPTLALRIAQSAPEPAPAGWRRWLPQVGLVSLALAGVAAGVLLTSLSLTEPVGHERLPSIFEQTDAELVLAEPVSEEQAP